MDKVTRVEQTGLGTVFMCTHAGTRYGNTGCRRTYLSQRDLQAHINHRHVTSGQSATQSQSSSNDYSHVSKNSSSLSESSSNEKHQSHSTNLPPPRNKPVSILLICALPGIIMIKCFF